MSDIVLFHIHPQQNLQSIIENEGLIYNREEEEVKWSKLSAQVPILEDLINALDEDVVLLRVTIPLDEIDNFKMYKAETDVVQFDSWYFEETIPISYLAIATYDDPTFDHTKDGQPWSFKPLTEYNVEEPQVLPDLLTLSINADEFDMTDDFMEANESLFERINDQWKIPDLSALLLSSFKDIILIIT